MSRSSFKNIQRNIEQMFAQRIGTLFTLASPVQNPRPDNTGDGCVSNGFVRRAATATDNEDIFLYGSDSDNAPSFGGEAITPMTTSQCFFLNSLTGTPNQTIFMAMFPMKVTSIQCKFSTANGAALTAQITKESGVQAPAAGGTVMSNTFNLNGTTNTLQTATLADYFSPQLPAATSSTNPTRDRIFLQAGDRLSIKFSTALTSLAGILVTVHFLPGAKGHLEIFNMNLNAGIATQGIFLANRLQTVRAVSAVWATACTVGGATMNITKDTGTQAPGAGTNILNAALATTTAANTVNNPALTATAATLQMASGDRLSVTFSSTTNLVGIVVAVWFQSVGKRKEAIFNLNATALQGTQGFFTSDIDHEIVDISEIHATAGGASNLTVTIDGGGVLATAPGAGTLTLTDNSNAGFNTNATANTVQVGSLSLTGALATSGGLRNRIVPAGATLSVKTAGTLTNLAGVLVAVSLRPLG